MQITVNGVVKSTKTSTTGVFKLSSLPPGPYTLTTALTGYQTVTGGVTGLAGQTVVLVTVLSP